MLTLSPLTASRIDSRKDVHGRWTSLKTYSLLVLSAARKDKQDLVHQDGSAMPGAAAPGKYPVPGKYTHTIIFVLNSKCKYYRFQVHNATNIKWFNLQYANNCYYSISITYTGHSRGHAYGMASCGHRKIACVRAYYLYCMWLAVLTSLQFLTVTKICLWRSTEWPVTQVWLSRSTMSRSQVTRPFIHAHLNDDGWWVEA